MVLDGLDQIFREILGEEGLSVLGEIAVPSVLIGIKEFDLFLFFPAQINAQILYRMDRFIDRCIDRWSGL